MLNLDLGYKLRNNNTETSCMVTYTGFFEAVIDALSDNTVSLCIHVWGDSGNFSIRR